MSIWAAKFVFCAFDSLQFAFSPSFDFLLRRDNEWAKSLTCLCDILRDNFFELNECIHRHKKIYLFAFFFARQTNKKKYGNSLVAGANGK